ncbi:hypothetical protein G7Y89_g3819 [Cudoniella acicularis]|uniref:Uncharacterized protein n=1 Tax=Cudoniella acicularis TaxID=354080 RepID=A0A8H4RSR6_9HELO|nr:hypothetical protein G7Y89_g3819 [Cudoniella acicularis]
MVNPLDKMLNYMTGGSMKYLSSETQDVLRTKVIQTLGGNSSGTSYWYHPAVPMDLLEMASSTDFIIEEHLESPAFSRYYCCLNSDLDPSVSFDSDLGEEPQYFNESDWKTLLEYLKRAFWWEPFVEEKFEYWSNTGELQKEAERGCHLCTLMWNTMNEEQQNELLDDDLRLAREATAKLASATNDVEREQLEIRYRKRKATQIKI